jgi:hypothetical protein
MTSSCGWQKRAKALEPFSRKTVAIRVDNREIGGHFGIGEALIDPWSARNFSGTPARLLGIFTPGGLERMFVAMDGRPLTDFPQVAAEFLVEIVGPPIQPVHGDHVVLEFVSGRTSGP